MNLLRKASSAVLLAVIFSCAFNFSNAQATKITKFEAPSSFNIRTVSFQEWYAGIEVGGTGFNVFVPVSDISENAELDTVYFRNLKAKLVKDGDEYVAALKNDSPYYTFEKSQKPKDYPVNLRDNECVISYKENGQTKYYKVRRLNEYAGTYYEEGHPSLATASASVLASNDEEEDK